SLSRPSCRFGVERRRTRGTTGKVRPRRPDVHLFGGEPGADARRTLCVLRYMRESRATRRIRATAALGFTLLSAVACGVGEAEDGDAAPPRAAQAPPAESGPPPTVEQLAAKTGCTPKIQV